MTDRFVTSALLDTIPGVRHAFSTRVGGVSVGAFASLNLSHGRDDPRAVEENRARLREAAGLFGPWVEVRQVHGTTVVEADEVGPGTEADAVVVREPGRFAAVRTADCVPALIVAVDDRGRPVTAAAVHAGWRGAVAGIVPRTLDHLRRLGFWPTRLRVALGPAISMPHFEVGPEVLDAATGSLDGRAPRHRLGPRGRPLLDLVDLVRTHFVEAGVEPEHVDVSGRCTYRDADVFFSHRRQRGRCGHHLSLVGFEP